MKRVCLYFGSFNPIHIGHLSLARHALAYAGVDELWFVLSPSSPHKQGWVQLPADRRAYYIERAIAAEQAMLLCRLEESLPRPNYTVRTLRALELLYPKTSFSVLMGADNLMKLDSWYAYRRLLAEYHLLVYPRPGYPLNQVVQHLALSHESGIPSERIELLDAPLLDVSSTKVREAALEGRDLRSFLPYPELWEELIVELRGLA